MYNILLEKALSDQEDNTIISQLCENLMTKDYFNNYQIEKLIMQNENVGDSFNFLILNQLYLKKFSRIKDLMKFYSLEKLDYIRIIF